MKVKIVVALGVLALLKDAAKVLVIASPIDSSQVEAGESEFETLSNCSHVEMTEECVVEEGEWSFVESWCLSAIIIKFKY